MKRIMFLLAAVMSTVFANAMSYSEAREEALYLTDKMAYELNLTEQQYNDAYEINLDYLMGVRTADEVYGSYWRYRNDDLQHTVRLAVGFVPCSRLLLPPLDLAFRSMVFTRSPSLRSQLLLLFLPEGICKL